MSGYARLARAWGAEVRGWDRVRTPYLDHLEGIDVEISDEPPEPPRERRRPSSPPRPRRASSGLRRER